MEILLILIGIVVVLAILALIVSGRDIRHYLKMRKM